MSRKCNFYHVTTMTTDCSVSQLYIYILLHFVLLSTQSIDTLDRGESMPTWQTNIFCFRLTDGKRIAISMNHLYRLCVMNHVKLSRIKEIELNIRTTKACETLDLGFFSTKLRPMWTYVQWIIMMISSLFIGTGTHTHKKKCWHSVGSVESRVLPFGELLKPI